MAVAKALGARRILAIDVQSQRLDFAKQYAATDIHLAIPKEKGEDMMAYSKRHVSYSHFLARTLITILTRIGEAHSREVWLRGARRGH